MNCLCFTELCVCDVYHRDALCSRALSLVACSRDRLWQIFSLLEVVHAAVGLVGAKVMTTLLQVVSRIFIVWMIMIVVPTSPTVDMRTSFCASPHEDKPPISPCFLITRPMLCVMIA